jgi:hypothetical protein
MKAKSRRSLLSGLAERIVPLVGDNIIKAVISSLDRRSNDKLLLDLQQCARNLVNEALQSEREILQRFIEEIIDRVLQSKQESLRLSVQEIVDCVVDAKQSENALISSRLYLPNNIMAGTLDGPYMAVSNVVARDFMHPEFAEFCRLYRHPVICHRKLWEWAFIYHHLRTAGALSSGNRGLGFGVGQEQLPSLFASLGIHVTATDATFDEAGWRENNQYLSNREQLFYSDIVDRALFDERVSYQAIDMNAIPENLKEFDFCWSSCSLEHLGTLQNGIDFVTNSIEKTLKIGGVACHTTELNLTSDEETIESGTVVIYRKKDLEQLCQTLEDRGHTIKPLRIEPGDLVADYLVDVPPYRKDPHLKLQVGQYVTTSVGIVCRRGQ